MKKISEIVEFIFTESKGKDKRTAQQMFNDDLKEKITLEEEILKNEIRLQTLKQIDTEKIIEVMQGAENLDEYIASAIQVKIAEKIPAMTKNLADNVMYNMSSNTKIKNPIKLYIINKIRKMFGATEVTSL